MGRKLLTRPRARRARRTGQSPYAKHRKREYKYSPSYYAWRRQVTGKAHRLEAAHVTTARLGKRELQSGKHPNAM